MRDIDIAELDEDALVEMLGSLERRAVQVEARLRIQLKGHVRHVPGYVFPAELSQQIAHSSFSASFQDPLANLLKMALHTDPSIEVDIESGWRERPMVSFSKGAMRVRWILDWSGLPWPGVKVKTYTADRQQPWRIVARCHYRAADVLEHLHASLNAQNAGDTPEIIGD
jgi:hypothetical protein